MPTIHEPQAIAITGIGLVTPIGTDPAAFSAALDSGHSALRQDKEIGRWVPRGKGPQEGRPIEVARVGEFGARAAIDPARLRRIPRIAQFCIVAGRQALGLGPGPLGPAGALPNCSGERIGVVLGTGLGSVDQVMEFTSGHLVGGPDNASPTMFPTTVMNTGAAMLAMELQLLGPNITVNHRDLSAVEAVATARDQLLRGRADAILAGGFEELGPWVAHGYARLGALGAEGVPMRPYDRRRAGTALGEGAVLLLLEREQDARARGATVLARLAGVGRGGDDRPRVGWRRPGEDPPVAGAVAAVQTAMRQAGLSARDIDYVAGGGNGTDLELVESRVLRAALGTAAETVPISSILGQTGESMMSPALRLAVAIDVLRRQRIPGSARCEEPDAEAALPGLCLQSRAATVRSVLIPVLAQGGATVALVLTAP
ncbi:MAG: beta-ketoacyl synthase N-terminal-like domain-containing protein [Myxococcales bacterium]|nr:hypothetical protein [Myxococcota bacterium]MDW8281987.1 beta-ketoacyl synthase N-terminal-like domain-containing protein [Myxococcales bacterium]